MARLLPNPRPLPVIKTISCSIFLYLAIYGIDFTKDLSNDNNTVIWSTINSIIIEYILYNKFTMSWYDILNCRRLI